MKRLIFLVLAIIALALGSFSMKELPEEIPAPIENTGKAEVVFVDVDQGDCTFVRTPTGETVLIDGGEYDAFDSHLAPFLSGQGVEMVDTAVVTHYHSDHMGGIYELVKARRVNRLVLPDYEDDDNSKENLLRVAQRSGTEVEYVSAGDIIPLNCNEVTMEVLHPVRGGSPGKNFDNNSSLVIFLTCFDESFLITGDIESRAEKELLQRTGVECDVLKIPHHGSSSSSSKAFIRETDPTYGIISAGVDNSYGHPHYEVLEDYENEDVTIYRTDHDGSITFVASESGMEDITFSR